MTKWTLTKTNVMGLRMCVSTMLTVWLTPRAYRKCMTWLIDACIFCIYWQLINIRMAWHMRQLM